MIKVGITGGIGSGKSTICKVFSVLGIPVFVADEVAKKLMNHDERLRAELIRLFGEAVYLPDGTIHRKYLADIVFNDQSSLEKLNGAVHPAVHRAFEEWVAQQDAPYVLHEAAILFESGFNRMMNYTITIVTNEQERIERVMKRDKISEELVRQRIKNQFTDEQRIALADFVIKNNEEDLVIPQVLEIDRKIRLHG